MNGIIMLMSFYPAVFGILGGLLMVFYPLTNQIMIKVEGRLDGKAQGVALMWKLANMGSGALRTRKSHARHHSTASTSWP